MMECWLGPKYPIFEPESQAHELIADVGAARPEGCRKM